MDNTSNEIIRAVVGTIDNKQSVIAAPVSIPTVLPADPYKGEAVVTPSSEEQILATKGKYILHDITINPVPSNYGLITWDGVKLTVS